MKKEDGASPSELLELARGLVRRADPSTAGLWPRAAAFLALRALDASVLGLWRRRKLDLEGCSMRAQLICLRSYLEDVDLAARVGHVWSALNRACHHHTYELAPTAWELDGWFSVVDELVHEIGPSAARPPRS
jgi:hypothetical protein